MRLVFKSALSLLSLVAIGAFLYVVIHRIGYRYELEWLESGLVEHVRRLNGDLPLYNAPTVDFVQFPYPPVFVLVSVAVATVVGDGFLALRLVSFMATLVTLYLLFALVRRETEKRWAGLLASGAYAASYGFVGTWFDVGKIDSLFIALTLAGVYQLRQARSKREYVIAALFFALAILTKQTALVIVAPIAAYLLTVRRLDALPFVGTLAVVVGGVSAAMHAVTDGWFTYFVWTQLLQHQAIATDRLAFWTKDMIVFVPTLLIVALALPFWRSKAQRFAFGLYGATAVGCLAGAWASRLHEGGFVNVLMPVCMIAAIFLGCSAPALLDHKRRLIAVVGTAFLVLQFNGLAYSPSQALPSSVDKAAGDAFTALLRDVDGDVLVTSHPTYAVYAGKASHAQHGGTYDVLRSDNFAARDALRRSYADAIYSGRYAAIVLDYPGDAGPFPADWKTYYRQAPLTAIPKGALKPKTSESGVPSELWLRIAGDSQIGQ